MPSRHRSRQRALQVLFQIDFRKQPVEDAIRAYYDSLYSEESEEAVSEDAFMEQLVRGTAARAPEIDARITSHSENWRIERMPGVDRNILRLAIYEMDSGLTPPAVVINEALELARRFSGDDSTAFINGILDAIRKETPEKNGDADAG
ncbi:MAG: transcription antitermination factor NusB [Bryobacteraceae bacterium]